MYTYTHTSLVHVMLCHPDLLVRRKPSDAGLAKSSQRNLSPVITFCWKVTSPKVMCPAWRQLTDNAYLMERYKDRSSCLILSIFERPCWNACGIGWGLHLNSVTLFDFFLCRILLHSFTHISWPWQHASPKLIEECLCVCFLRSKIKRESKPKMDCRSNDTMGIGARSSVD